MHYDFEEAYHRDDTPSLHMSHVSCLPSAHLTQNIIVHAVSKCLPGFSTTKLFLFSTYCSSFWEESVCVQPMLLFLRVEDLYKLYRVPLHWRFIYAFILFKCNVLFVENFIYVEHTLIISNLIPLCYTVYALGYNPILPCSPNYFRSSIECCHSDNFFLLTDIYMCALIIWVLSYFLTHDSLR